MQLRLHLQSVSCCCWFGSGERGYDLGQPDVPADAGRPPRLFSVASGPARLHSALGIAMRRYKVFFVALILLLLAYAWWLARSSAVSKSDLSVVFVGITNNPQHTMKPVRVEVCQGATGVCALFRV